MRVVKNARRIIVLVGLIIGLGMLVTPAFASLNGYYGVQSVRSGKCLEASNNPNSFSSVWQYDCGNFNYYTKKWTITEVSQTTQGWGVNELKHTTTGGCLAVPPQGGIQAYAVREPCIGSDAQRWITRPIFYQNNWRYQLVNKATGLCLDQAGSNANLFNVYQYYCLTSTDVNVVNQLWNFPVWN